MSEEPGKRQTFLLLVSFLFTGKTLALATVEDDKPPTPPKKKRSPIKKTSDYRTTVMTTDFLPSFSTFLLTFQPSLIKTF